MARSPKPKPQSRQVNFRAKADRVEKWREAALAAGLSLSAWMARELDAAASSQKKLLDRASHSPEP